MAADPLLNLVHERRHASLSAESLEMLGKQAANMYLNEGVDLNEGVKKVASAYQDINSEQIKRVCEFANTAVYLARHDAAKTAGANSSYPQFPLADPSRVIQEMSDGSRPRAAAGPGAEYSQAPKKMKTSSAAAESALLEMFGYDADGTEKTASINFTSETALTEVMGAKDALTGLKDNLETASAQVSNLLKEAQEDYYDLVKRHLLDGGDFADVMVAARASGLEDEKIAEVLRPMVETLILEKVSSPRRMSEMCRNLEKVAHRVVNEKHPFVAAPAAITFFGAEVEKIAAALEDVNEQLGEVRTFIREHFHGRKASR